ncbi:MAG TPA: chorismate-binding protein [Kofleriaceae bacterium]|nr:chorismate-binding protein [Kofleriaceae bacterium]
MRVVPAIPPVPPVAPVASVPPVAFLRRTSEISFVAYPAPVVAASALVAAFRSSALVAWSSPPARVGARCPRVIVGIGVAAEARGHGDTRWRDVIAASRGLLENADVIDMAAIDNEQLARPRLLGGLAFAPGAADRAPWSGFGDAWFMLPRWTYIHDGTRGVLLFARRGNERVPADELADLRVALAMPFTSRPQPPLTAIDHGDRDAWRTQVRAITDAIARGEYTKIVAARSAVVSLAGEARAADMLAELDARHPETARVLVRPSATTGSFIAASPERLVRFYAGKASVDALAGSRARSSENMVRPEFPRSSENMVRPDLSLAHGHGGQTALDAREDQDARELLASGKDRREHAIVVDAIVSALREQGADVRFPDEPTIRTLRHVLHLHTPITADFGAARKHVLELAEALHPTPAVGGTPTRASMRWIAEREQAPRGWYSSPVGWFDSDGNGELAVAIRSGVLAGDRAHLWAGAGIVAGSDPDRELAETDLKLRAMLGALGVSA